MQLLDVLLLGIGLYFQMSEMVLKVQIQASLCL